MQRERGSRLFSPNRLLPDGSTCFDFAKQPYAPGPRLPCGVETLRAPATPIGVRVALELDPDAQAALQFAGDSIITDP